MQYFSNFLIVKIIKLKTMETEVSDYLFRAIVVGDSTVGKTQVINQF